MRVSWRQCLLAAIGITCLSSVAWAREQDLPSPARETASSNPCVLHVWPGDNARSSYMGWFHGGAVDGDRRGIKGYPAMHAEVLSTAVQEQLLSTIKWAELLSRPGLSVIVHEQPPVPQDDVARAVPLTADRPSCHQELLIHSVFVEKAALSSTSVRVMVIAKSWHGSESRPSTFSAMANEKVDLSGQPDAMIKQGFVASVRKLLNATYFHEN